MSIAQKSLAIITTFAVAAAILFSFVATIQVAQAATVCPHTWSTNLKMGSSGADVMALQQFLNSDPATQIAASGVGSPGSETSYFGGLTKAAVIKFQNKYSADVLVPNGLTVGTGNFFTSSRAKANMLCTGSTTTTPPATGTGVAVNGGTQPSNALAPEGASRVPFTRFSLTAGADGDVVVNSIQVQRTGLGSDAAFQGVILVDEATGMQIGTAKTFNSNHQAAIGQSMTIPRGTTKTFLVAGNMQAVLDSYAGEAPSLSVVGVNTSATVSGSLPIAGANHTINATLLVGALSLDVSNAFASNSNASKEIGTTGHKFTGFRLTAGSSEDLRVKSIMFNQAGSVSSSDLANVAVVVNGTSYPTVLSADGRYYTATLGSGVVIAKGNQVDVYIQADIVGSNSSGRTVIFDVDKNTDIFATGETYGYGISPTTAGGGAVPATRTTTGLTTETTGTPYIYAAQVSVTGASITTIAKANEVAAQKIAINLANQVLGGYVVDIKGENLTVQSTVFTIASTTGSGTGLLTNVTLVDENGAVVAGPVDATYTSSLVQTVTFTDTITYKTGRHIFTLKGKVASTIGGNGTYIATTVNGGWTNVRGETSGNTIALPTFTATMNTMTVKAGALVIGPATSPASQTIVPGGQDVLMANFQFDAQDSGEDVRFSTLPARLTFAAGAASTELSSCKIVDGATVLTTGSNTVNPSGASASDNIFTLDNPVVITKGAVKTLGVRCNVSGSAANAGTFIWTPGAAAFITNFTISGAVSGTTITASNGTGSGPTFTIGTGTVTVSTDASSPSYTLVAAGSTDKTNGVFKFRATNENINLTKLGLKLTNTASSSAGDLVKASIYDGATKVGEVIFGSGATYATSTLSTPLVLVRDVDKAVTVKIDYADVGSSQPVLFSGHLVALDFASGEGTGVSSGSTFNLAPAVSGSTAVAGQRVMKSLPTVALDTLASTGITDGRLMRFKVTADAKGPVSIAQFGLSLATSTITGVTNVTIFAFTDANYSNPASGIGSDGNLQQTNDCVSGCTVAQNAAIQVGVANTSGPTILQVPAGGTLYFEVKGSVAGVVSGSSVTTKVLGSSAFPATAAGVAVNPLLTAAGVITADATAFVWSPNSTTTVGQGGQDWTNGFGLTGLPSGGLIQTRSQ